LLASFWALYFSPPAQSHNFSRAGLDSPARVTCLSCVCQFLLSFPLGVYWTLFANAGDVCSGRSDHGKHAATTKADEIIRNSPPLDRRIVVDSPIKPDKAPRCRLPRRSATLNGSGPPFADSVGRRICQPSNSVVWISSNSTTLLNDDERPSCENTARPSSSKTTSSRS